MERQNSRSLQTPGQKRGNNPQNDDYEQQDLLKQAFDELQVSLSELRIAEAKLRQQAEELLQMRRDTETEQYRYKELLDFVRDAYLVTDHEGTIREANRAAVSLLGINAKSIGRISFFAFIRLEDHETAKARIQSLREARGMQIWNAVLRARTGRSFPATLTAAAGRRRPGEGSPLLRWLIQESAPEIAAPPASPETEMSEPAPTNTRPLPNLEISSRHRASDSEPQESAHLCDVLRLADGRIAPITATLLQTRAAQESVEELKRELRDSLSQDGATDRALSRLNDLICRNREGDPDAVQRLILSLAVIDEDQSGMHLSAAGAGNPVLLRADGSVEIVSVSDPAIGSAPGYEYAMETCSLLPGDSLVLAAIGKSRSRKEDAPLRTEVILPAILKSMVASARTVRTLSANALSDRILTGIGRFAPRALQDGFSLLVLRRLY